MEKQCAGCGKVFEDGEEPLGQVSPRPYGCCEDCNASTFRTNPPLEVKLSETGTASGEPAHETLDASEKVS